MCELLSKTKKKLIKIGVIVFGIVALLVILVIYLITQNSGDGLVKQVVSVNSDHNSPNTPSSNITADVANTIDDSIKSVVELNNEELLRLLENRKIVTIAVFGTDERSTETSRSDVIMVMKYYPNEERVEMVSIPRDTRVEIPGHGLDKINHAFAFGGAELASETIENFLNIKLDYYIKFNFDSFGLLVDKLGGVNIVSEKDFYSDDYLVISEGEQTLDGYEALYYVRFRHDSDGDYGRIKRQQQVTVAIVEKMLDFEYKDLIPIITEMYNDYIETNLTVTVFTSYLEVLRVQDVPKFNGQTLKTYSKVIDGIWYELYEDQDLIDIQTLLQN